MLPRPPRSPLFPYTTPFRSQRNLRNVRQFASAAIAKDIAPSLPPGIRPHRVRQPPVMQRDRVHPPRRLRKAASPRKRAVERLDRTLAGQFPSDAPPLVELRIRQFHIARREFQEHAPMLNRPMLPR